MAIIQAYFGDQMRTIKMLRACPIFLIYIKIYNILIILNNIYLYYKYIILIVINISINILINTVINYIILI